MKYYHLDPEEQKILTAFEQGQLVSVPDFPKIKQRAVTEGIPYQTLVSSVLHKFANS